jgi:hypothetical protein
MTVIANVLCALAPGLSSDLVSLETPTGPDSLAPRLVTVGERTVLSWLERSEAGFALRAAEWRSDRWEPLPGPAVDSELLFVNWADTPGVRPHGAGLLAHWLEISGSGSYTYDVRLATSDGGSWDPAGALHTDRRPAEHGFVSFAGSGEDDWAFWLDGRGTLGARGDDEPHGQGGHGHGAGSMRLYAARIGQDVRSETLLDDSVCDCCPTAAGMTADGPIVAYRDRVAGEELRDVRVVRWTPQGWSRPIAVHAEGWRIPGCPVNGPSLAARGQLVELSWFTMSPAPRVMWARSTDGGRSFEAARPLVVEAAGRVVEGRPALEIDPEGGSDAILLLDAGGGPGWYRIEIDGEGTPGAPELLVASEGGRRAGFPARTTTADGRRMLALTEVEGDRTRVVTYELR